MKNAIKAIAPQTVWGWMLTLVIVAGSAHLAQAQSVGLPTPRLLTVTPMGAQVGTSVEVTVSGEYIDDSQWLLFSHPGITAEPKKNEAGEVVAKQFVVSVAPDTPPGLYEARMMTQLGATSCRAFSVGELPESQVAGPITSLDQAQPLELNSLCNAAVTSRSIDHFSFTAQADQLVSIECSAVGIDSKLKPVVIVADEQGGDLQVERSSGWVDFKVPQTGTYVIKIHDLTFQGGPEYFYRLAIRQSTADQTPQRLPATRSVSAFSWPPAGLAAVAPVTETEDWQDAQAITLPCDIAGSFFPAADVDVFEFDAKAGEVWWVEVASERLGRPTNPAILVEHVATAEDGSETLTVVTEMSDIASPIKPSGNQYAYDGPPYNGGSPDILAKLEIKQDGKHRLQLRDLFGGTRRDPNNRYRLVIRQPEPDFALVTWALHMELRNGDRNALSKPMALRPGATMAFEVAAIRRDGFAGPISVQMDDLPEGVEAAGFEIPAGQTRGMLLITASEEAPSGWGSARLQGTAQINGETVTRPCPVASMAWPVRDHWQEIPKPRLLGDVMVSVASQEPAPISITPTQPEGWDAVAGKPLTVEFQVTQRCEFSGAALTLRPVDQSMGRVPNIQVPLDQETTQVTLDLAALKTPPGTYQLAFHGPGVAKYRFDPGAIVLAEDELRKATGSVEELEAEVARLTKEAAEAASEQKSAIDQSLAEAQSRLEKAKAAVEAATKKLDAAKAKAQPKDIANIVVTQPLLIRVHPAE